MKPYEFSRVCIIFGLARGDRDINKAVIRVEYYLSVFRNVSVMQKKKRDLKLRT